MSKTLTLRQLFAACLVGLVLSLGFLFALILRSSQEAGLESAEQFRQQVSDTVADRVKAYLDEAPSTLAHFEREVDSGLIDVHDPVSLRNGILGLLLSNDDISEISFTTGASRGSGASRRCRR